MTIDTLENRLREVNSSDIFIFVKDWADLLVFPITLLEA